MLATKDLKPQ